MITLDYNQRDQTAVFSATQDCPAAAWASIRRLCEERGKAVENRSGAVVLPWWSLLVFREALGFVVRQNATLHATKLSVTPAATELLKKAKSRQAEYSRSASAPVQIPAAEIQSKLESLGWNPDRQLKPYQARNVSLLASLPASASFSVPGAGKTTEAIATFLLRRSPEDRLLVVAPKNAFAVWEEQIEACAAKLKLRVARLDRGNANIRHQLDGDPDVMIVSYQTVPRAIGMIGQHIDSRPCFMFLDESHRMKRGLNGVSGSAILNICHLPIFKLVLSGTPMPNAVGDLIPQFNFLYPEVWTDEGSVVGSFRPVFVRTRKSELGLEMPHRVDVRVPMGPAQTRLYRTLTDHAARSMANLRVGDGHRFRSIARSVMQLIQAASDPSLLHSSAIAGHRILIDAIAEPPPKIIRACDIARRLASQQKKVVIWSSFVSTVEHLSFLLQDLGAEFIHGGVDTSPDETVTDSREAKLRRFHDSDDCMVLIANPAACAEGISLHTVCHHAIYVDRTYNAAHYLQSEDRIHRLGLDPNLSTEIILLRAPGTIDDSVQRRLAAKVDVMQRILDDPDLNITPIDISDESDVFGMTQEDLDDLKKLLGVE